MGTVFKLKKNREKVRRALEAMRRLLEQCGE
jgi:hypothetical protein